jgi:hypothetical protein
LSSWHSTRPSGLAAQVYVCQWPYLVV